MSWAASAWARTVKTGSGTLKLVLFTLAESCNAETHTVFLSVASIAEAAELDRKTVISALDRLEAAGLIADTGERVGKTRQVKVYRMLLEATGKTVPAEAENKQAQKRNCSAFPPKESQKRDTEPFLEPNTPLIPPSTPHRSRHVRRASAPDLEPIITQKPLEGWEASEFRSKAAQALGDGVYRNLIQPCHIARSGDDLFIQAPCDILTERIKTYRSTLVSIMRAVGCSLLRIETKPKGARGSPDPKVADAVRQLEAIRGGRVAGAALQAGGRR